jgi:hypothetical protein
MKSASGKRASHSRRVDLEAAVQLLSPTLGFLSASGLDYEGARHAVETAWAAATRGKGSVTITSLNNADAYREIVSAWTNNPAYLDSEGIPLVLRIRGKRSFASLVHSVDKKLPVQITIKDLHRYGNVRRLPGNRLKLLKSFLHVSSDTSMAFEPHFAFLANASSTVGSLLGKRQSINGKGCNFWRIVEELELPEEHLESYLAFIRRRSLPFLQEIDEWLRAHSSGGKAGTRRVRAGLGLFTFGRT